MGAGSQASVINRIQEPGVVKPWRGTGTNEAVTITVAANANRAHRVRWVTFYFTGADPTDGVLTIAYGGTTIYSVPFTARDLAYHVGHDVFGDEGLAGNVNEELVITLPAGGTSAAGVLQAGIE